MSKIMHAYRELQEFEMTSKYNARHGSSTVTRERYSVIKKHDSNRKQPIYPPVQASNYINPVATQTVTVPADQKGNADKGTDTSDEENAYQSLIMTLPGIAMAQDGYVKLTRSVSLSLLEGTPPPSMPPPAESGSLRSTTPQLICDLTMLEKTENVYSRNPNTL